MVVVSFQIVVSDEVLLDMKTEMKLQDLKAQPEFADPADSLVP